jgi:AraC-like DNA-binding protein
MIHFSYSDTNYLSYFPKVAKALSSKIENNCIRFAEQTGKGYMELIALGDNIHSIINNYVLNTDIEFNRKKNPQPFFILHFIEMKSTKDAMEITGEGKVKTKGHVITSAMLTCSLFELSYILPAHTSNRGVNIILTKEWIQKYMDMGIDDDDLCSTFFSLKVQHLNEEPFNTEYRNYFNQIFDTPEHKPMRELHIRNTIMMLVEIFFKRLHKKTKALQDSPIRKMNPNDLYKLMDVESILVKDFSKSPPTIVNLATYTNMSVSKLKSSFKRVYGSGIYEYFQKNRMQKAKSMLVSNGYSVKEVGLQLGYTNLSNFSLAFKKEFGLLPSQI